MLEKISNKNILIIGGTGSLGNALVKRYLETNELYLYSRDESKHWSMQIDYKNHKNLNFIIGDIYNKEKINQTILRGNFNIIIIAAALKHIDKCEYETDQCINTNLLGTQNVLNSIEKNIKLLSELEKVCFISTDKACSPVNIYGMTKAASECLMIEKSKYIPSIKFVCTRYGNVLNSRGSIIPMLHKLGKDQNISNFNITDRTMTRFVMTLDQSVDLVEHALIFGESGDIVIPKLISCNVIDLIEIFSELYKKPIVDGKLRPGEKMLESLINETQSMRLINGPDGYMYIKPPYKNFITKENVRDYNSTINPLSKEELKTYLKELKLIEDKDEDTINFSLKEINIKKDPFMYFIKKNILPENIALKARNEILNIPDEAWDRYDNPFENKFTLRDKNNLPETVSQIFKFLTSSTFLEEISNIYGIKLYNDPTKNWWGIHKYNHGDKLDIHVDAGLHPISKQKKQVTLGIYLSKNWKEENGGHLEIWKGENCIKKNAKLIKCKEKMLPEFNTLLNFENNDYSWHGNPYPVNCKNEEKRIFLTISYVSENYNDLNKREKAFFIKHPDQPDDEEKDKLRLLRADPIKYKDLYNLNKK